MRFTIVLVLSVCFTIHAQRLDRSHAKPLTHSQKATKYPTEAKTTLEKMRAAGLKPDETKINVVYPLLCKEGISLTPEHILVASRIGFQRFKKVGFDPNNVSDPAVQRELQRLREFVGRKRTSQNRVIPLPLRGSPPTLPLPGAPRSGLPLSHRPVPPKPPLP